MPYLGSLFCHTPARTICSIIEHHDNVSLPGSKMLLREHWEKFPCPFLELISQYYCMVVCVPFLFSMLKNAFRKQTWFKRDGWTMYRTFIISENWEWAKEGDLKMKSSATPPPYWAARCGEDDRAAGSAVRLPRPKMSPMWAYAKPNRIPAHGVRAHSLCLVSA